MHRSKLLCWIYIDICAKVMHSIPIDSHSIGFSKNHISFLTLKSECLSFPFHAFMSLSMTSYTVLNRRGERKHPCFILDDRRSIFSNLPLTMMYNGLPKSQSGKESACQHRNLRKCSFDPGVGKVCWSRTWQPTPVFLPGKSHGQRSLVGCNSWGLREPWT